MQGKRSGYTKSNDEYENKRENNNSSKIINYVHQVNVFPIEEDTK